MPDTLVAAGGPVAPPRDWFENPRLTRKTPMEYHPDGRVFGHIATWDQRHIGFPQRVIHAPRNANDYAGFRVGHVVTADGASIPTGRLTIQGGHADRSLAADVAARWYDDSTTAYANVVCGEDEFGIWVAGSLIPNLPDEVLSEVRATAPSGDWRRRDGQLDMIAAHNVNTPGFPVPRVEALVADGGEIWSLVAAGAADIYATATDVLDERLTRVETILLNGEADRIVGRYVLIASANLDRRYETLTAGTANQHGPFGLSVGAEKGAGQDRAHHIDVHFAGDNKPGQSDTAMVKEWVRENAPGCVGRIINPSSSAGGAPIVRLSSDDLGKLHDAVKVYAGDNEEAKYLMKDVVSKDQGGRQASAASIVPPSSRP